MLPPGESLTVSMPTGQTDGRQNVTLRFPLELLYYSRPKRATKLDGAPRIFVCCFTHLNAKWKFYGKECICNVFVGFSNVYKNSL